MWNVAGGSGSSASIAARGVSSRVQYSHCGYIVNGYRRGGRVGRYDVGLEAQHHEGARGREQEAERRAAGDGAVRGGCCAIETSTLTSGAPPKTSGIT